MTLPGSVKVRFGSSGSLRRLLQGHMRRTARCGNRFWKHLPFCATE